MPRHLLTLTALLLPSVVCAHANASPVDDGYRLSVDTLLFTYERVEYASGVFPSETIEGKTLSLGGYNLGLAAGIVRAGSLFVGARGRLVYEGFEDDYSTVSFDLEPLAEGMLDLEGPVRPFGQAGIAFGGVTYRGPGDPTQRIFRVGFSTAVGIHAFVADSFSFSPSLAFRWYRMKGDVLAGKATGFTIGLNLSVAGWIPRDRGAPATTPPPTSDRAAGTRSAAAPAGPPAPPQRGAWPSMAVP